MKGILFIAVAAALVAGNSCEAIQARKQPRKLTMDYPTISASQAASAISDLREHLGSAAIDMAVTQSGEVTPEVRDQLLSFLKDNKTPFVPPDDPKWSSGAVADRLNRMIVCLATDKSMDAKSAYLMMKGVIEHAEYVYTFDTGDLSDRLKAASAMVFAGEAFHKLPLSDMWRLVGLSRFITHCPNPDALDKSGQKARFEALIEFAADNHIPVLGPAIDLYEKATGKALPNTKRIHYKLSDDDFYAEIRPGAVGLTDMEKALVKGDKATARQEYVKYLSRLASAPSDCFSACPSDLEAPRKEEPDEICRNIFVLRAHNELKHDYGKDIDWTLVLNNDVETNVSINGHQHLAILADAYQKTGDEKYADNMARIWDSWYTQSPCPDTLAQRQWRTLECGIRASYRWSWMWHYGAKSKVFRDKVLFNLAKSYLEHARYLSTNHSGGGNWSQVETGGLLSACVLFPEWKEADRIGSLALRRLRWFNDRYFFSDGFQTECATLYHQLPYGATSIPFGLSKAVGCELPKSFVDEFEKHTLPMVYTAQPDFTYPGLNDGDPRYLGAADSIRVASGFFGRSDFRYLRTEGKEGKPPAQTSYQFPDAGYYIMRDSWDRSSPYLLFDAGYYGSGHQHEDKLNFVLCAYGRPLIIDPGIYRYVADRFESYFRSTFGHNCIVIDGKGQRRGLGLVKEQVPDPDTRWITRKEFDFAQGWYKSGYSTRTSDRAKDRANAELDLQHERTIFHPRGGYFIVHDKVVGGADKQREIKQMFHVPPIETDVEQRIYEPGNLKIGQDRVASTSDAGLANIAIIPVQPDGISKVDDLCGQAEPFVAGWTALDGNQPSHDVVYTRLSTLPAVFDTVLYPTPVGVSFRPRVEPIQVVSDKSAVAFKVIGQDFIDIFVISNDGPAQIKADSCGLTFDGELLYLRLSPQQELKKAMMVNGKAISFGDKEVVSLPNALQSWTLSGHQP